MITIGVDIGISATKVVMMNGTTVSGMEVWEEAFNPERLERYISANVTNPANIDCIAVTGVGSVSFHGIKGINYKVIDEFSANAKAAGYACQSKDFIVVSVGTATSFVKVNSGVATHLGGSAMGGGTLFSLFHMVMQGGGWANLRMLAEKGDLKSIDKTIGDVSRSELPDLPLDATAINLGKFERDSRPQDVGLGLVNLVLQNIGVMANLAGKSCGIRDFVMLGRTVTLPHAQEIFSRLEKLYGINIIVPKNPEFMTAIGAALCAHK